MTTFALSIFNNYLSSYQGLQKSCWQGILLSFIESTFIGVYYFLPLYFISELNINVATAGMMISFYGVGTILGGFLGGRLSDRTTPALVQLSSLVLQGLSLFMLLKLHSITSIIIDLFFMGIASYAFITANHLWVLAICADENAKLKAINILGVVSNLGSGISSVMISIFAIYGFRNIFGVSAVCILLAAVYFYQFTDDVRDILYHNRKINRKNQSSLQTTTVKFNNTIFYLILCCLFLIGLIIFQMNTTYSVYIEHTFPQYGLKGVGLLYSLNCFLVVLLQAPLVSFFRDQNKLLMAGIGAFLLGFGMFILSFAFDFWIAILSCFIYTMGEMIFFSVAQFICYHSGSENKKGNSLGMYRMVYACSRVAGPMMGGYAFQQLGSQALWTGCGLIGLFSLMACGYYAKVSSSTLEA